MMRLTEALYCDSPQPEMIDYYERVLINHIFAAYEPERGMIAYMTKMQPGGFKTYSSEYDSFWCCTGTGFESPAKFQKMIYTYDADSLYVNLFIPSVVNWKEKGITLKQETKIPDEEQTVLTLQLAAPAEFSLKIRHPAWVAEKQLSISINGETQTVESKPSQFIELKRRWQNGDKVVVKLPMKLSVAPLTAANKFFSFTYGPVVLAAEVDSGNLKKSDYWDKHDNWGGRKNVVHTATVAGLKGTPEEIAVRTQKVSANPLSFKVDDYTLIPFNRIHYSRYVIYFPAYEDKSQSSNSNVAKVTEPNGETVDRVLIANAESEKEHKMEAVSSQTGTNYEQGWRHATNGGYFMYELKCLPDKPQELYFIFNAPDSGKRTFDVKIDGKTITTIDHSKPVGEGLHSFTVPIPEELTKGKTAITVKLQAKRENTAGGIFDLRVVVSK
jgi:hypothetical protein